MKATEKIQKMYAGERRALYDFLKGAGFDIEKNHKELKVLINGCVEKVLDNLSDEMLGDEMVYNFNVGADNVLLKTKVMTLSRELECLRAGKNPITTVPLKK